MPNGCCKPDTEGTKHYSCETCHNNGCCAIYEHCISCCLQPDKVGYINAYIYLLLKLINLKIIAERGVGRCTGKSCWNIEFTSGISD